MSVPRPCRCACKRGMNNIRAVIDPPGGVVRRRLLPRALTHLPVDFSRSGHPVGIFLGFPTKGCYERISFTSLTDTLPVVSPSTPNLGNVRGSRALHSASSLPPGWDGGRGRCVPGSRCPRMRFRMCNLHIRNEIKSSKSANEEGNSGHSDKTGIITLNQKSH